MMKVSLLHSNEYFINNLASEIQIKKFNFISHVQFMMKNIKKLLYKRNLKKKIQSETDLTKSTSTKFKSLN